ncbi:MAG: UDP-N-acetylglucosamine pyrophosphorylase [Lachnospiraceae bacterium]|nr:UDP-N-acetylglucosamine pyrophosphorylase [Lachnospiraceae bacterium]
MAVKNIELFDLSKTMLAELIRSFEYPWEVLSGISDAIIAKGQTLSEEYTLIGENIWAHKSAKIAPTASITGPCIIDEGAEVRHCAFVRGSAMIGKNCVVGNSTELKNVILFDNVQVPHYNYVGDSILGFKSHMGAGSITSNVKSDKTLVVIKDGDVRYETGRKKIGAILGDFVEVGCGSVLNPGTIIGPGTNIYPLSSVRGVIPANSIYKHVGEVVVKNK